MSIKKERLLEPWVKIWLGIAISCNSIFLISHYVAITSWGTDTLLWFSLLFVFPLLIALFASPICFLCLIFEKTRMHSLRISLIVIFWLVTGVVFIRLGGEVRMSGFERLASRSVPLVTAIGTYEKEKGHFPIQLSDLVPDYLDKVPKTGMRVYPEYKYYVGEDAKRFYGNPWVLIIFAPSGAINFDIFMYFPLQNYPPAKYGGTLERVGAWAYVHE